MVDPQPLDPLEFLEIADSVASEGASEAALRTAVDRTYFAVFLAVRETLQVQGRSRIHGRVIGELRRHDKHASQQLERLMRLRGVADYELEVEDPLRRDWRRNYRVARQLAGFILARVP